MVTFTKLTTTLALFSCALALSDFQVWGPSKATYLGCETYISDLGRFCSEGGDDCWCDNVYARQTMLACLKYATNNDDEVKTIINHTCRHLHLNSVGLQDAYTAYEEHAHVNNGSGIVDFPIKLNSETVNTYKQAFVTLYGNKDLSAFFGLALLAYWLAVFTIASLVNLFLHMFPRSRLYFNGSFSAFFRFFFTLPAFHKSQSYSKRVWGCLAFYAPSRMQTVVTTLFAAGAVVCCCVGFHTLEEDPLHNNSVHLALVHYIANRTGIVSTFLVPLVVLMAGRNNFLQWTTGWHYGTFMTYHRWIARVTVLIALIHAILATVVLVMKRIPFELATGWYVVWGIVATAASLGIIVQSFLHIRRKYYSVFYLLHVLFGIAFLGGTLPHLAKLGYLFLIYTAFLVWGLDRLARLGRMIVFGFPMAQVTVCSNETLRVEIPRPRWWLPVPGGHVWLSFGVNLWMSHPFTICPCVDDENTIVFLCAVKLGATLKMLEEIKKSLSKSLSVRVTVEGPYGGPAPTKAHDNVVYVAGGNGVPGMFSEAYYLAKRAADSQQAVKLVWSVREPKSLAWFYKELSALADTKVEATVYVSRMPKDDEISLSDDLLTFLTSTAAASRSSFADEKTLADSLADAFPHVEFVSGRCDVEALVERETMLSRESVAFVCCGHPAMVDDLRAAVVNKISRTTKRVDFFDQLQGWS